MEDILKIELGQQLPPERWLQAADNMEQVFPAIAERLRLMNYDGKGREDAEEFMDDATLALIALRYVGNAAHDKCRFIALPDK